MNLFASVIKKFACSKCQIGSLYLNLICVMMTGNYFWECFFVLTIGVCDCMLPAGMRNVKRSTSNSREEFKITSTIERNAKRKRKTYNNSICGKKGQALIIVRQFTHFWSQRRMVKHNENDSVVFIAARKLSRYAISWCEWIVCD